jgi:hypothetical protein
MKKVLEWKATTVTIIVPQSKLVVSVQLLQFVDGALIRVVKVLANFMM